MFTTIPGECQLTQQIYYNLLSETPGVIRSPEIEHHDLKGHSKNKSTNLGVSVNFSIAPTRDSKGDVNGLDAKMGDGILGTASFGHQTKDVRTKVQPTITKTNATESNTDTSSINDEMKNAEVVTSKKGSNIQAFVPLVNPMDIPKLWDRAVDNFNGAIDKPLMTPPKKPQIISSFMDLDDQGKAIERKKELKIDIIGC